MAVSIDRVYQKVLAFANKEQGGYITPQEFNLFADQAQMEIFEQYFYDMNQWTRQHKNNHAYADMIKALEGKIDFFEHHASVDNITVLNKWGDVNLENDLPNLYKIGNVRIKYPGNKRYVTAEQVTSKEFQLYQESKLAKHTRKRPVYLKYRSNKHKIKIYPYPVEDDGSSFDLSTQDLRPYLDYTTVMNIIHPSGSSNDGKYFYFNEADMVDLLGEQYQGPHYINVTVVRDDANGNPFTVYSGEVILWDSSNPNSSGALSHGRRHPWSTASPGDFELGDKIYVTSDVYQTSNKRNVKVDYIRKPKQPNWNYVVVNEKPMYNATNSVDFELHPSEETELVYRILAYSGIAIDKPQLTQTAAGLQTAQIQQEKQ